jgi:hypothetical protein
VTTSSSAAGNQVTADFDYTAPADLFPARSKKGNRPFGYRRFETAAEAIRYAIEAMPTDFLPGAVLQVEDVGGPRIRKLYDSAAYPVCTENPRFEAITARSRPP